MIAINFLYISSFPSTIMRKAVTGVSYLQFQGRKGAFFASSIIGMMTSSGHHSSQMVVLRMVPSGGGGCISD